MAGQRMQKTFIVTEEVTAKAVGSGENRVLATPMMVAWMENTAAECVKSTLQEGQTTVGGFISTSHLSPTPVGMQVTVTAEVTGEKGSRIELKVSASDSKGLIGEGSHTRFVVDKAAFQEKADQKR